MRRRSPRRSLFAFASLLILAFAVHLAAAGALPPPFDWAMTGRDARNSRTQPYAPQISPATVSRLAVKWVLTTNGDVSATPAVVAGRGSDADAVYVPDWGGRLWKVNANTGAVIWVRQISEYTGIANAISRTTPVVADGLVYVGDLNGNIIALEADTGDVHWITEVDSHPATIITASPVLLDGRLYVVTSSNESRQPPNCCTFRGSLSALDAETGAFVWKTYVLPANNGVPGAYAGGAFVNPPAIDDKNGVIVAAAGQLYTQPASVTACLAGSATNWNSACFSGGALFNSIVAFDLDTGAIRWAFRGAGDEARQLACGDLPAAVTWCPRPEAGDPWTAAAYSVWDFAGSGANFFTAKIDGKQRDLVGVGQKSGVYWTLDAKTGELVWSTLVGPGSDPGGIQWGTAYDGKRIYAAIGHNTHQAYVLKSGAVASEGSWAALDPATGDILWQTADPQNVPDLASLSVANDVVFAGSMAHTGSQMYALDANTGSVLWQFAAGGSVVGGPAIVGRSVFWGSGYARTGGVGNNKLYAFSIDGK
jgi:polyvinyl alcohol dehydrogenase (cytochrome)